MLADQQGYPLSGATVETVDLYNQAIEGFNLYRGDPFEALDKAIQLAPSFAMVHILKAYLYAVATEPAATRVAKESAQTINALNLNERETSLMAPLVHLLEGRWNDAAVAMDFHNAEYPLDLVGIQCGHLMDFYRANARDLRDRIARVLPHWSSDQLGYSVLLGMYAFGLEECGHYSKAEDVGGEAIEREPYDCWAHHAVSHVMEMQGRVEDGIHWMRSRELYWAGDDNFFRVHNWWHLALYHLDQCDADQALALYDGPIRAERSTMALDMVDASALLWRLMLAGHDLSDRWQELAQAWQQHADGKLYPFNDWHAAMAWLGAGDEQRVKTLLSTYRSLSPPYQGTEAWAQQIGLPLIEGFYAFWQGDYQWATEFLYKARYIFNSFGGSHAQRDIIDWTLIEAALRVNEKGLARALAHERMALKPRSLMNLHFLSRSSG